jgi:E3 ubiquitin-protein ligase MARCH6
MNEENQRLQTLIQPRDVSLIVFGYLTYAMLSFSFSGCVNLYKTYFRANLSQFGGHRNRVNPNDMNTDEIKSFVAKTLIVASDCAAASSKISLLVCFKMFVLPLTLGIWLDLSTLQLFENSIDDRLTSAGADIIGAFLLHWVVGITFMLTVTVSILQLREVLHPDLLAPIIRPQEPQPDLLLQLLQESGFVHLKRMIPSVAIYASLLCIHIWLPCRLLRIFGVHTAIPLFRPKFWHLINPSLQSAVELLCFHLGILSILEKQKNTIGLIQYNLLMKLSSCFGITKSLLPFATSNTFALVGEIELRADIDIDDTDPAIHNQNEEILLTLSELHKKRGVTDLYLESKLKLEEPTEGTIRAENIVIPDCYIIISPESSHNSRKVMPTRMGKYRFRKRVALKGKETIEIWKEEATEPIPRPPKDWDYLADDNAVDKGRWAWGKKEKKSEIEQNVASRDVFFPPVQKNGVLVPPYRSCQGLLKGIPIALKLASIVVISWIFTTTISSIAIFGPLIVGRFITHLLHIPDKYIHDPFLFCVGCTLIAPVVVSLTNSISMKNGIQTFRSKFSFPSLKKQLILFETLFLWLFVSPLFIGVLYDTFLRNESLSALLQVKLVYMMNSWSTGFLLLHLCGAALFYGAFRREFWYTVRTLAVEGVAGGRGGGANRNNDRMAANRPRVDNNGFEFGFEHNRDQYTNQKDEWQGNDGRVGMFLHCIHSALWKYEWDKIDKDILLEKTLYPLLQNTLTAIVIPMSIFLFTTISFDMGVTIYRASVIVVVLFEICSNSRGPLKKWYISAHKAARDHRYLIGKILLNYEKNHKLST